MQVAQLLRSLTLRVIGERVRWEKITAARTLLLVLLGFAALALCAFLFDDRAGWGVIGVELLLLAYLTDAPAEPVRR